MLTRMYFQQTYLLTRRYEVNTRGGGTRYIPGWGGAARPLIP